MCVRISNGSTLNKGDNQNSAFPHGKNNNNNDHSGSGDNNSNAASALEELTFSTLK